MKWLGLILLPQSDSASDSICFKYMDRDPERGLEGGLVAKRIGKRERGWGWG